MLVRGNKNLVEWERTQSNGSSMRSGISDEPSPARRHLAARGSRRKLATGTELAGRWRGAGGVVRTAGILGRV